MHNRLLLGPWIRRFLLEHLIAERNLSHNTQTSYRDTLVLLLTVHSLSLQEATGAPPDRRCVTRNRAHVSR